MVQLLDALTLANSAVNVAFGHVRSIGAIAVAAVVLAVLVVMGSGNVRRWYVTSRVGQRHRLPE